jgi:anti-sigma regulatory factor (Ser/Thr protein kinase)
VDEGDDGYLARVCRHALVQLEGGPGAPRQARRAVRAQLEDWGLHAGDPAAGVLDRVLLATSELVTNAVTHGLSDVEVKVIAHRRSIEIAVADDSHAIPVVRDVDLLSGSGRGLAIVEALAAEWGVRPGPDKGKDVWCRFEVAAGSALGRTCSWPDDTGLKTRSPQTPAVLATEEPSTRRTPRGPGQA